MKRIAVFLITCFIVHAEEISLISCATVNSTTTERIKGREHPLTNDIALGFASWKPTTPYDALSYAEHLAKQDDPTSKQWAQAIIFHGAGFGGFAKNRTASQSEMGQYFHIIYLLKGMIPDEKELGLSGRADVTYHQNVMNLLAQNAAQPFQELQAIFAQPTSSRDSFYWLGRYNMHQNDTLKDLYAALTRFKLFEQKSASVYAGCFDAAPHVHPYGTDPDEATFAHYTLAKNNMFIVISEPLDSWQKKDILLRPHAYIGHHAGVRAGGAWVQNVEATITRSDGQTSACSGSVHIHDHVASPSGVMVLGKYEEIMAKGPFVTHLMSHYPVKTLHILIPSDKQGLSVDQLTTESLVGYLSFIYQKPAYQQFMLDQLRAAD